MHYAIDTKGHVYAFTTNIARNRFVFDCVTTDAYAITSYTALEKMRRYCINRAAHKPAEEFARICEWVQDAREVEIVEKYASYFV